MSIAQQYLYIKAKFPEANLLIKKNKLFIKVDLCPTEVSRTYPIEIIYKEKGRCEAWLVGNVFKIDNLEFPHKYRIDELRGRVLLCLYHPDKFEWNVEDSIAETIIPWCIEWLLFYELWLSNGVWLGGGEHPSLENDLSK